MHNNDQLIWRKGELEDAPDDLHHVGVRQREAGVLFLGIIASDSKVGPSIWVPDGVKINAVAYRHILEEEVRPWIDANWAGDVGVVAGQHKRPHGQRHPEVDGHGGLAVLVQGVAAVLA